MAPALIDTDTLLSKQPISTLIFVGKGDSSAMQTSWLLPLPWCTT
jgi:hypothetical protein